MDYNQQIFPWKTLRNPKKTSLCSTPNPNIWPRNVTVHEPIIQIQRLKGKPCNETNRYEYQIYELTIWIVITSKTSEWKCQGFVSLLVFNFCQSNLLMTSSRSIPSTRQSRHFLHADHPVSASHQVRQRFPWCLRKQQACATDQSHHNRVTDIWIRKMDTLQKPKKERSFSIDLISESQAILIRWFFEEKKSLILTWKNSIYINRPTQSPTIPDERPTAKPIHL